MSVARGGQPQLWKPPNDSAKQCNACKPKTDNNNVLSLRSLYNFVFSSPSTGSHPHISVPWIKNCSNTRVSPKQCMLGLMFARILNHSARECSAKDDVAIATHR